MAIYNVKTEKFGTLQYVGDSIAEARAWAKSAHGVGPRAVTRHVEHTACEVCDCAPCACADDDGRGDYPGISARDALGEIPGGDE